MAKRLRRRNERVLGWLRAAGVALAASAGLLAMQFRPTWGAGLLALLAGGLALASIELGVTVAVLSLAIPLVAANPVLGIAFAVLAVASVRYVGADGGKVFLLIAAAILGAFVGPIWAPVAVAGLIMGASEGAVAAAIACLAVEALGVAMGEGAIAGGVIVTGAGTPLVTFTDAPANLFAAQWIPQAFSRIDAGSVDALIATAASVRHPLALVAQPAIWALGAIVTSALVRPALKRNRVASSCVAVAAGTLVPAAGLVALGATLDLPVNWGAVAFAAVSSAVVAALFTAAYELGFPAIVGPSRPSLATDDAEVDELLRLIATAEEKLATRHTTTKVVMITDMKSFSRMAEEDGSIVTAKAIQRHRDLLLPIIETHHGHGKSTGGDGLVAAFDRPVDAFQAASEMQRALCALSDTGHPGRETSVRIGVARGEVVLDKGGRPFIGTALNLAARIMNLADGGQVFAAADLTSVETGAIAVHSHGTFELKNITQPVEVVEVLWAQDQQPRLLGASSNAVE